MIEHIWSIVCNSSSIDTETNTINLFRVLEQIVIFTNKPDPINLAIQLEIFSDWIRENENIPTKGKMRVFFCDPSENCQKQAELDIDLEKAIFFRTRIRVNGLKLKGNGKYKFIIELQQEDGNTWEKVANLPILVTTKSEPLE